MSHELNAERLVETKDVSAVRALLAENARLRDDFARLQTQQANQRSYHQAEIRSERGLRALTGQSPAMKAVRRAIQQVAATDSTVLILGETGTGKELVARAIHQASARHPQLLVTVNCASLAPALVASELFGHEAGAFTGATKRRVGRFETAHQGTLFLDEIAEVPIELQPTLLRVLQEKSIERVGSNTPLPVDVRLIAATHANLEAAISAGTFRADLFFRLNVFPIRVPALRERVKDIPDLANHFAMHFARRMNKPIARIADKSLDLLTHHSWPGNVRELENCIERAVIVAESDTLTMDPAWFPATSIPRDDTWHNRERQTILEALEQTAGRIYGPKGAAARLGLKPTTLYGKMRKLGIRNPKSSA